MLVILVGLMVNCAKRPVGDYSELTVAAAIGDAPRSLAVLPFRNRTSSQNLEDLVRKSFYSHLSVRPKTSLISGMKRQSTCMRFRLGLFGMEEGPFTSS
jgi:hypothetical protein